MKSRIPDMTPTWLAIIAAMAFVFVADCNGRRRSRDCSVSCAPAASGDQKKMESCMELCINYREEK